MGERGLTRRMRGASLALAMAWAAPALAQQAQGDPSQGTGPLPSPNAAPVSPPICTDRPTKANVACTVPAGDVQIESDLLNWTREHQDGARQDTILYTNPTIKVGLGTHTDLEVALAPYETMRTTLPGGGHDTVGGIGDLTVRLKQRLTADNAKTQVALIPFVTAPTARSAIGAGQWQGGLIAAVNVPLPADFTLTFGPEADVLGNDDGAGHHAAVTLLTNLSHSIVKDLTGFVELWTQQNFDPAGTEHQYSLDLALAYQLGKRWEFDVGGNFGLNRMTPGTQLYLGLSTRF